MRVLPRTVPGSSHQMRQRSFAVVAVIVGLLVAGTVAAFAYDSTQKTKIAKGVSAGGIYIGGLNTVPAKFGVSIRWRQLTKDVNAALVRPDGARVVIATSKITKPKVTTSQLASKYSTFIIVDRGSFKLRFFKGLKLSHIYPIAVGMQGLETPAGLYHIQDKQVNPSWHVPNRGWAGSLAGQVIPPGPADPIKARWMGFNGGAEIHGTAELGSLGSAASHGCIRMAIPDVEQLYDRVSVGTPVFVA